MILMKNKILQLLELFEAGEVGVSDVQSRINYLADTESSDKQSTMLLREADNSIEKILYCAKKSNQQHLIIEVLQDLMPE